MADGPNRLSVLVLDDDAALRAVAGELLSAAGYDVALAGTAGEGLALVARRDFDAAVVDVMLGPDDGLEVMERLKAATPHLEVILATGFPSVETAVLAMRRGAFQYLAKPVNMPELLLQVERAARKARDARDKERLLARLRREEERALTDGIVASAPAMRAVLAEARDLAALDKPVCISGETGTGKELVATLIHRASARRDGPFTAVNCGTLEGNLIDAELFGHEKGAYTGADRARLGLIPASDGGTLFLDEIGDIPEAAQVRLLRFLEDGMVRAVGGARERRCDVRIVCASHKDLARLMEEGRFRQDLYHRLVVFELRLPPLRERGEDIEALALHFLRRLDRAANWTLEPAAADLLRQQSWPGNIRELRNEIERAWLRARRRGVAAIAVEDFRFGREPGDASTRRETAAGFGLVTLVEAERRHVQAVVARCEGNRRKAAAVLGISERHLYRLLRGATGESES